MYSWFLQLLFLLQLHTSKTLNTRKIQYNLSQRGLFLTFLRVFCVLSHVFASTFAVRHTGATGGYKQAFWAAKQKRGDKGFEGEKETEDTIGVLSRVVTA